MDKLEIGYKEEGSKSRDSGEMERENSENKQRITIGEA